jgi:hypothetical protein
MPFTPFHMGPGVVLKAALGRHFSLTVFGCAQVAMDLEPLLRMLRGDLAPHGLSHTYFGAVVIGCVSLFVGRAAGNWLLRFWSRTPGRPLLEWLRGPGVISWPAAATGAFIGTFSHVLFDSVMHAEMHPFWPFAEGNSLVGLVSMEALHLSLLAAGFMGVIGLAVRYWVVGRGRAGEGPDR